MSGQTRWGTAVLDDLLASFVSGCGIWVRRDQRKLAYHVCYHHAFLPVVPTRPCAGGASYMGSAMRPH